MPILPRLSLALAAFAVVTGGAAFAQRSDRPPTLSSQPKGTLTVIHVPDAGPKPTVDAGLVTPPDAGEEPEVPRLVSLEAEFPTGRGPGKGSVATTVWEIVPKDEASSGKAVEAWPNIGEGTMDSLDGARLDYRVELTPGRWHVWLRVWAASADDASVHVGLDGEAASFGGGGLSEPRFGEWAWVHKVWARHGRGGVVVDVEKKGAHVFSLWVRQDGLVVDKIVLTTDPTYEPTGEGPPAENVPAGALPPPPPP